MNEMAHTMEAKGTRELIEEMLHEMRTFKTILLGDTKELGLIAQHRIMWRFHTSLLCALSAAIGIIGTIGIQKLIN